MTASHSETDASFDDTYESSVDMFGEPYEELQDYFKNQISRGSVLDLGSGQGRDALFLASLGYQVTAVDTSKVGVAQMLEKIEGKNLRLEGIAADIVNVQIDTKYKIILFDMVLHAFEESQQVTLIEKYTGNLAKEGKMCIVFPDDMSTAHFMKIFDSLPQKWELKDEIVITDIPKANGEESDSTFVMIVFQRFVLTSL